MDIGKKIRQAREEQGYSQEQLANELGITTRTLQNYEYGKSDVGVILITKIANILKINSDYFFKECSSPIVRQGITTRTLQNYEYGKSDVGVILITKIANILKINSDYFFKECSSPIVRQNNKNIVRQSFANSKNLSPNPTNLKKNEQDNFYLIPKLDISASAGSGNELEGLVRQSFANSKNLSPNPTNLKKNEQDNFYLIPKLDISASAGSGNELEGLECYESGQMLAIDKVFFKTIPMGNIKAIRVDGYSMVPMLLPDSWVIFEEGSEFKGDGLYIINYANQLMVKLLQLNPFDNILEIISVNKDYKSYQFHISETQELMLIKGRVLRAII